MRASEIGRLEIKQLEGVVNIDKILRMSKGRKPLPNAVRKLRGTDRPCRTREDGVTGKPIEKVESISGARGNRKLSRRAKDIFMERSRGLMELQILTTPDLDQLALYAAALDMAYTCISEIEAKGLFLSVYNEDGLLVKCIENPHVSLLNKLIIQINKLGSEYGFTPVSRQKLRIPEQKRESPLRRLMNITDKEIL